MPMYMDIHEIKGATAEAVAKAHEADVETQKKYGVEYHKYWFNKEKGKVFCICSAPDKESAALVHQHAHGMVAEKIIEVDPDMIEKSRDLLSKGYARLASFECKNKGYEWFGEDPGHEALSAYGLMEFTDMSVVRDVDRGSESGLRGPLPVVGLGDPPCELAHRGYLCLGDVGVTAVCRCPGAVT